MYWSSNGGEAPQLLPGSVVQMEAGDSEVLGQVLAGSSARYQQSVRGKIKQPGQGDLNYCRSQPGGQYNQHRAGENLLPYVAWPSQQTVRNECDVSLAALFEDA